MRFRLIPRDDGFFDLFDQSAANVVACSRLLRDLLKDQAIGSDAVHRCEAEGDTLTRDILQRLNSAFVTPFDREDIHALAEQLDDIVDNMLEVAYLLDFGDRDVAEMPELIEQADLLVAMADEVAALVGGLKTMKGLGPHLDEIDRLETVGDGVYREALRRLYSVEFKAKATLYWKDVTEAMEDAIDAMEDISDIAEAIVLKHA